MEFTPSNHQNLWRYPISSCWLVWLSNLQRNIRNGDAQFRWTFINFLMIVFTIPVLVLLALQSDLGTALVFVAIFRESSLTIRSFLKNYYSSICDCCNRVAGFLAILSVRVAGLFLHQLGMPTYQINRILAGSIHSTLPKQPLYQQAQGQIAIGERWIIWSRFNVLICLFQFVSRIWFFGHCRRFWLYWLCPLIALYLMLIYRMLKITLRSNNQFYTYISTGLIMMLLFHIFEGISALWQVCFLWLGFPCLYFARRIGYYQ